jgi:hydroxymethylpyrimidine/phosphomethylpyrimidine kinase
MTAKTVRILTIAGSDSGGGAGIQADIKTIHALGGYAMTAITAITVQDTVHVHDVHAVPPEIVAEQIRVVMDDIGADAVKTGMLVSARHVEAIAQVLRARNSVPLVVDTVMIAKGGQALLDDAGVQAMQGLLFPLAALITPNAPEAARLTGIAVDTTEDCVRAGQMLRERGARAVLVKGAHVAGDMISDVLVDEYGVRTFVGSRIANPATHGTGCTLASAIATGLGQGLTLRDAVARGHAFVREAIAGGLALGRGDSSSRVPAVVGK